MGKKWSGFKSIGRVVREVQREGKQTSETSYYITSLEAKVGIFSDSVRRPLGHRKQPALGDGRGVRRRSQSHPPRPRGRKHELPTSVRDNLAQAGHFEVEF